MDTNMLILLTGEPGVGKSTVLMRLVDMLKEEGIYVGGVVAREVRDDAGKGRVGFEFVDVSNGSRARLASLSSTEACIEGPRIGKYSVDLDGCRIAAMMLLRAINSSSNNKVVVFDEIGPMEMLSSDIVDALRALLDAVNSNSSSNNSSSSKNTAIHAAIVVIHKRLKHWMISKYREIASMVIEVNRGNRDALPSLLLNKIKKYEGKKVGNA
ncbi:MAG: nucleoside-triphosphatase [Candidatus Nitrosocaldus sp.]